MGNNIEEAKSSKKTRPGCLFLLFTTLVAVWYYFYIFTNTELYFRLGSERVESGRVEVLCEALAISKSHPICDSKGLVFAYDIVSYITEEYSGAHFNELDGLLGEFAVASGASGNNRRWVDYDIFGPEVFGIRVFYNIEDMIIEDVRENRS